MLQMILQLLNIILHLSQVQILINIYNMPQHLLSICMGCKYSSVSCVYTLGGCQEKVIRAKQEGLEAGYVIESSTLQRIIS